MLSYYQLHPTPPLENTIKPRETTARGCFFKKEKSRCEKRENSHSERHLSKIDFPIIIVRRKLTSVATRAPRYKNVESLSR